MAKIAKPVIAPTPGRLEADLANRAAMLKLVRRYWIEGVLHKSIWNQVRLSLNFEGSPNAVVHPVDLALRRVGQPDTSIPPGTPILDIYRQEHEELLLLGEPGSGKTTLLLEIAETLLQDAGTDTELPIPVIFNLSAWRNHHKRLDVWLVEQLCQDYLIPKKIAKQWVDSDALLLLLDGLDEVAESRRAACVEAINFYRQRQKTVRRPMVICCRTREYDAIPNLRLSGAVVVQPLTNQQVDGYLSGGGKALAGLRAVLKDEPTLYHELFSTPLMLHVAIVAYEGQSATQLRHNVPTIERQRRLWDGYIERMFERKQEQKPQYEKGQALDWLAWLGKYLTHKDLQKYFIEQMQPNDLPQFWRSLIVRWTLPTLFALPYLSMLVIDGFHGLLENESRFFILYSVILGWVGYRKDIRIEPVRRFAIRRVIHSWKPILVGTVWGAVLGAVLAIASPPGTAHKDWVSGIEPQYQGVAVKAMSAVSSAGISAVIGTVWGALLASYDEVIFENTIRPNEGIHRSFRTVALGALFGTIAGAGVLSVFGAVLYSYNAMRTVEFKNISDIVWIGAIGAILGALALGGKTVFQHYILRLLLWQSGRFPYRITRFLDWATQRALVQRVSGGWRFVHRTLQERFAERYDAQYSDKEK